MVIAGGALSGLSVVMGAFGAHALRNKITAEQLQSFETGVRYQLYHGLALILLGLLSDRLGHPSLRWSAWLFLIGTCLFSGSIYLLSNREWMGIDSWKSFLGPIIPLGGLSLILGWCSLVWAVLRSPQF